ncbi:response regulator transcription factor [Actinoplanes subtropicus]|uniref:response regulator transcription factor n=1 Tax=Actinoplanes subtropicus TaxID=543632 RepID=UPI000551D039|nr:response regulator transcription factor [Actinoplanes subtropicus]
MGGYSRRLLAAVPDAGLRDLLVERLGSAGYLVEPVHTGADAMTVLRGSPVDLIIVDVDIPDLEYLARNRPSLDRRPPILCVTSCDSLEALIPELGTEVEDYVTKPCRLAELVARVRVLLRGDGRVLRYADLALDEESCQAWRGDQPLALTAAEYRLLRHLLRNAGRVLSKEQLAWEVWDEAREVNAVERLMSRLRQKLGEIGPARIQTRRGFGYSLAS